MAIPVTRRELFVLAGGLAVVDPNRSEPQPASIRPVDLRCEYLVDPQGIDARRPRLSWRCEAVAEGAAALRQTAYRIRAASHLAKLSDPDIWDSGQIESDRTQHITYDGRELGTRQQVVWSVQIWDEQGRTSAPSPPSRFSIGLLEAADWQGASWIGLDTPWPNEALNAEWFWVDEGQGIGHSAPGTRYFRRHFTLDKPVEAAELHAYVTAGDYAKLSVDGVLIGEQYGWADASSLRLPALPAGPHVIAAEGLNLGNVAKAAGLAVRLDPLFSEASGWLGAETAPPGWQDPSFDDSGWRKVVVWGNTGIPPWGHVSLRRPRPTPARWLRREFTLNASPQSAFVSFCGLGWSELYINGTRIGDACLSPPLTDYDQRVIYVTHEVTSRLRAGPNVLGVVLGAGRFVPPRPNQHDYGWPKLKLRLDITGADLQQTMLVSDAAWLISTNGPILDANEYDGEVIDARRMFHGWSEPGFDASAWQSVELVAAPTGRLCAISQAPTRVTEMRAPVAVTRSGESWTFDFGQNLAGLCRLRTSGPSGARITLHHAERLRPDGALDTANLRSALARDEFVLAGTGEAETYTPRFTSHGFRYVTATGLSAPPSPDTLVACVVSDDLPRTGWFDCSDKMLTRIHDAALWSVRNNCRSIRTDCPQRDERQGWLGDPAEEARGEAYLFDNAAFYAKWLDDMLDAQRPDGAMPDIAPAYWAFYNDDLSWPATLAIIPGILFEQFGDTAVIARVYPHLSRWLDRMWEKAGDTYGDWGFMGMRGMNAEPFIAAAYLPYCHARLATYAMQLGEQAAASVAESRAATARARFHERFFRPADGLYADGGATACILALAFDLASPSQRPVLIARLTSLIMARGEAHPCFGLIGAQWVNRVLQQAGRGDLAHQMAVARTRPGLGYMIAQGATTLWELWDGDTADPAMSSLDHTMLTGDLLVWLYQDLAGIGPDPSYPGFARVILAPKPTHTLDWVRATYDAKTGRVESAWRREAGNLTFDFVLPPNVQATVMLPGADPFQISSGSHRFTRPEF